MSTNKRSLLPFSLSRFDSATHISCLLSISIHYCPIYYSLVRKHSQWYCQDFSIQFCYIRMSDDSHCVNTLQLFNKQMNYKYIIMTLFRLQYINNLHGILLFLLLLISQANSQNNINRCRQMHWQI